MSVNVNTSTNTITIQQDGTRVIQVATPGPQGPQGIQGPIATGGIENYIPLWSSANNFTTSSIFISASSVIITNPISLSGSLNMNGNSILNVSPTSNIVPLSNYETNLNFGATLQTAINAVQTGSIIDCTTYTGSQYITSSININKPLTIKLGYININVDFNTSDLNSHTFIINNTSNVIIEGSGRSPKSGTQPSPTSITMNTTGSGYHIFGTGSNSITIKDLDLIGVQSSNYDLTTGAGGVCFLEPNPGISLAGNTTNNILLSNLFVNGTRDHGIYFVGSILSSVENCRISNAGGHGFFTTEGSTSTQFTNCYASSGKLAGFCIHNTSYSTLENCAAEGFGAGYWIRSSFNISLIGCGAESNKLSEALPVADLGITFGSYTVDDWTTSFTSLISGSSYVLTGGKNIILNNPYSKDPGGDGSAYTDTCHFAIASTNSGSMIMSPRCANTSGPVLNYDILVKNTSGAPRDLSLVFNPEIQGTVTPTTPGQYITTTYNPGVTNTVMCDEGINTGVTSGDTYYTGLTVSGSSFTWNSNQVLTTPSSTTGTVVSFTTNQVYNEWDVPGTGNITNSLTGAKTGIVQKIYHNNSVAPSAPAGWVVVSNGVYVPNVLNIIYAEWVKGTRVEYWITQ